MVGFIQENKPMQMEYKPQERPLCNARNIWCVHQSTFACSGCKMIALQHKKRQTEDCVMADLCSLSHKKAPEAAEHMRRQTRPRHERLTSGSVDAGSRDTASPYSRVSSESSC